MSVPGSDTHRAYCLEDGSGPCIFDGLYRCFNDFEDICVDAICGAIDDFLIKSFADVHMEFLFLA